MVIIEDTTMYLTNFNTDNTETIEKYFSMMLGKCIEITDIERVGKLTKIKYN